MSLRRLKVTIENASIGSTVEDLDTGEKVSQVRAFRVRHEAGCLPVVVLELIPDELVVDIPTALTMDQDSPLSSLKD